MKNGFLIFLASLVVLSSSWCGLVLAPVLQLGGEKRITVLNSSDLYPLGRPGLANQGLQVYRANGCAACHTEQVQQNGVACEVVLTSVGNNPIGVTNAISSLKLNGLDVDAANDVIGKITAAGGKAEIHIIPTGPDISRGWGKRHSVAEDFLYDDPVQLGSIRIGPDLADVGTRLPDANWQLIHLYSPQSVVKNSVMPPFPYLFKVEKIGDKPSPDALVFPKGSGPAPGYEVVPTEEAQKLVAYLLSLHADMPLHDAPFSR